MKKSVVLVIVVCILALSLSGLVGCIDGSSKQLDAPIVWMSGNVAIWGEDTNATKFELSLNGSLISVPNTTTSRALTSGQTLKVRAVGDNVNHLTSEWSNLVSYYDPNSGSGSGNGSGGSSSGGSSGGSTGGSPNPNSAIDLNFVMINDTHGAFTDSSAGYSIGRVDGLIQELTEEKGEQIFIQNGDAFQGSYVSGETYGLTMLEALNAMELDCFVIGNHEFDWGLDKIARFADGDSSNGEADFPFLGANIYYAGTTTRPDWIEPYTIVEQDGVKVGIIGVIGYGQESSILTRYAAPYDFAEPLPLIESNAKYLRDTLKCDVVVVSTHDYDESLNENIAKLSGQYRIDAIFCGHTHQNIDEFETRADLKQIPVAQCYHKNNTVAEVILELDGNKQYLSALIEKHEPYDNDITERVQSVITKYQYLIDEANEVLGTTSDYLNKGTLGRSAASELLSYAYTENTYGDIDAAIINTGGVRATIDRGNITRADVFEVFPFNNAVVIVNMSGKLLKSLIGTNESYFYYSVKSSVGDYTNLSDNTTYQLAVIDYVFEGTRYYQFEGCTYTQTDVLLREVLIDYIERVY
ncbi:MAG: bifunctional metallophosphatase/5'-nucleotidase [Clostridia bacterium]|nr:bifunctional metallophosphatase/5'-nucleotidase [Clostridia bacterium]